MLLINGLLRYLILIVVFSVIFTFEGGHASVFIFDTLVVAQFVLFLIAVVFYMETLNPQTDQQLRQTRFAGLTGFALAIVIPLLGGFVHYLTHYSNWYALGIFFKTIIVCVLHATLIYFSFFHWAFGPQAFEGLPVSQNFIQIRGERGIKRAILAGFTYLFYGIGVLVFIGVTAATIVDNIDILDPKAEIIRKIHSEGSKVVSEKIDQIETKYVAENCKLMPYEERRKIKNQLQEEQDKIDEDKIYKALHETD